MPRKGSKPVVSVTLTCQQCGDEFETFPSKSNNKFCSRKCYHESRKGIAPVTAGLLGDKNTNWRGVRIEIECEHCHKRFVRHSTSSKYCSVECASAEHGPKVSGDLSPLYVPPIVKTCEFCGNDFQVKPGKSHRKYCSLYCSNRGLLLGNETSLEKAVRLALEEFGITFIQEQPFGVYTADFYLPEYSAIIECDGEYWHSSAESKNRDRRKDAFLRDQGITVYRLSEKSIVENVESAVSSVVVTLREGVN